VIPGPPNEPAGDDRGGLHEQAGEQGPFIVAFHGGKDAKALDEIRKRHGLFVSRMPSR
jgi:hypothetical protein